MKAEEIVSKIFVEHIRDLPDAYYWEDERERMNELFYCMLARLAEGHEVDLRRVVSSMSNLNLLDIENLAQSSVAGGNSRQGDELASQIKGILRHNGLDEKAADEGMRMFCEVCKNIQDRYGNIQRFLRKHGEMMVEELTQNIIPKSIHSEDMNYIVRHWLQNTMEMPINLPTKYVQQFCKRYGLTMDDLENVSDKTRTNTAVIDDLIKIHMMANPEG